MTRLGQDPSTEPKETFDLKIICRIFQEIAQRFDLVAPVPVEAAGWLAAMDDLTQAYQLRLFLQTSPLSGNGTLSSLIGYYLHKQVRSAPDRDKLDFLLVQYLAECAPSELLQHQPTLAEVAQTLEPVLGKISAALPSWLEPAEDALRRMVRCSTMSALLRLGILQEIRGYKASAKDAYFGATELAAFARMNFIVRQTFFRLMRADVDAICAGVRQLRAHSIKSIDCRQANLAPQEPLDRVLELAQQWKRPFQAEYSAGRPFAQLAELRRAVEEELQRHGIPSGTQAAALAETDSRPKSEIQTGGMPAKDLPAPSAHFSPEPSAGPGPNAAAASASVETGLDRELHAVMKQLSTYLQANYAGKRTQGATIVLGDAKLALSSWEVGALIDGAGEFSPAIQQGVAVRVLLFQELVRVRQGGSTTRLMTLLPWARDEARQLQYTLSEVRMPEIEARVALSASAQHLAGLLNETECFLQDQNQGERTGV